MDLFTLAGPLCKNGIVTKDNPMWHGTDYSCTGSAHYAGEHIYCTDVSHHQDPYNWYPMKRYVRPEGGYSRLEAGVAYMPFGPDGQDIIVLTYTEDPNNTKPIGTGYLYASKWESAADGWMLD